MDIVITNDEYNLAIEIADETLRRFSSNRGHYNNTANSHIRGKVGEIAVSNFIGQLGFQLDPVFKDLGKMADADIIIPGKCRVEVKTWSAEFWPTMGRCIAVDQLEKLKKKADLLVWCISASKLEPLMNVELVGWNLISDIPSAPRRLTGPANGRQVDNYQLDPEMIRPIETLQSHLAKN